MAKNKVKHSVFDKIIYILISVISTFIFVWDIFKDFIPDEHWELKFLIIVIDALSGFFTVLSFQWDRKFACMSEEISSAYNKNFEELSESINTFMTEDFHSYDSFNEAIIPILTGHNEFEDVRIFAYSAKNYVECLTRSNVKIKKLTMCLKRANDFSAWFFYNEKNAQKYQLELERVLENLDNLKEKKQILHYEIRFYDFEAYSHFGIFDDTLLYGDLIPIFAKNKTVRIGKIQTLKNIGRNTHLFNSKKVFFEKLFSTCGTDSGLKIKKAGCHYCNTGELIQDPHHVGGRLIKYGKCDISLIENTKIIDDFLLEPDFHPISEFHILLVSKFHILNLFDYLYHKDAIKNLEELVYAIRHAVYKETNKEIILFEHGTATNGSTLSASSIEHLHLHIIYEPTTYDYIKSIDEDNEKNEIFEINNGMIRVKTLEQFAQESSIKNRDYFMIWKPGKQKSESLIYIWFPQKKESQYLRRIFFQGLSSEERKSLYGETSDNICSNEYDWKIHKYDYTDERLNFHIKLGSEIENEYKRTREFGREV